MFRDCLEGDALGPSDMRSPSREPPKPLRGVGAVLLGHVRSIRPFGAFVSLPGYQKDALLHISNISNHKLDNVEEALSIGQKVWIKIIREDSDKVAVSMKDINQDTGEEVGRLDSGVQKWAAAGHGARMPTLHSVHKGTVKRITPFGAFVAIEGFDRDGLLHISCISKFTVNKVEDVLSVGDAIWVKVTKVDDENNKYALDMRGISQSDGTDADPHNLLQHQSKRAATSHKPEAIHLEAVLNATCARCRGRGHLSHECYNELGMKCPVPTFKSLGNGQKYDILEDDDVLASSPKRITGNGASKEEISTPGTSKLIPADPVVKTERGEKDTVKMSSGRKHSKGKKKRKHRSSSSESSAGARKKRKKEKKHKR